MIEIFCMSLKWADKNILLALCALKNVVFVEKNNVATSCRKRKILLRCEAKTNILTPKKTIAPPPLKLNGRSLT